LVKVTEATAGYQRFSAEAALVVYNSESTVGSSNGQPIVVGFARPWPWP